VGGTGEHLRACGWWVILWGAPPHLNALARLLACLGASCGWVYRHCEWVILAETTVSARHYVKLGRGRRAGTYKRGGGTGGCVVLAGENNNTQGWSIGIHIPQYCAGVVAVSARMPYRGVTVTPTTCVCCCSQGGERFRKSLRERSASAGVVTSELYGRAVRGCGNGVGNGVWVLSERCTKATRRGLLL